MKKIVAIPTDGKDVSGHFGHCPLFYLFTVEDNEVIEKDFIENPGHQPGFLPRFLSEKGIDCILAGGMGNRAVELFKENGVEVVLGVRGPLDQVVEQYLNGTLETEGNTCDH
ncbi:MAG: dinitrogenase iron-molybdenum cofactor [Halanaerobiaceae bacterium]|jgi:predicted Fe-Mo cluster-binding NifX family protein|nr:dinitrogenase iron-molybdenum cofactor [Halanaerobiaceae bacterium]